MNKLNKLFAGFAAVAMLAACSNDEPVAPGDNTIPAGEKAYLTVNIQSAGDTARPLSVVMSMAMEWSTTLKTLTSSSMPTVST